MEEEYDPEMALHEGRMHQMQAGWDEGRPHPSRPGEPTCKHYVKTGECSFGPTCKFDHPPRDRDGGHMTGPINGDLTGANPCPHYMRTGTCSFLPNCRFSHPPRERGGYGGDYGGDRGGDYGGKGGDFGGKGGVGKGSEGFGMQMHSMHSPRGGSIIGGKGKGDWAQNSDTIALPTQEARTLLMEEEEEGQTKPHASSTENQDFRPPVYGQGDRGARGGNRGGRGKGNPRMEGPAAQRPTQLCVLNIPEELRNYTKIVGHFSHFGTVVDVQMRQDKPNAFITYNRHMGAKFALESPDAVCNNRFITVEWAKRQMRPEDEDVEDPPPPGTHSRSFPTQKGKGKGKGNSSIQNHATSEKGEKGGKGEPPPIPKSKVEKARELVERQRVLAQKQIEHQKQIVDKIMNMKSLSAKERSEMLKSMMAQMDANKAEMLKGGETLRAETDEAELKMKQKQEAAEAAAAAAAAARVPAAAESTEETAEGTEEDAGTKPVASDVVVKEEEPEVVPTGGTELEDQVRSLEAELKKLEGKVGIVASDEKDPGAQSPSVQSPRKGKGKSKGKGKGKGGKGKAGPAFKSLDLRPKVLLVSELSVDLDTTEKAKEHLAAYLEGLAEIELDSGNARVRYSERWQAEAAMRQMSSTGLSVKWYTPPKVEEVQAESSNNEDAGASS